jgi:recombinational DNA repair ATPase RecF
LTTVWDVRAELLRRGRAHGHAERALELAAAAADGEEALDHVLSASTSDDRPVATLLPPPTPPATPPPAPAPTTVELRSVRVAGFRGVGPEATLRFAAGPGLTLVVGRNGTGKSSFAEAIELALTGDNARWRGRSKVWRAGWRNLHAPDPAGIEVDFADDERTVRITVARRWEPGAELEDASSTVHGPDGPTSLEALGWAQGLETYRPFLPYSELGAVVDEGPTALHDALSAVLGLDLLTAAAKRLRDARLLREREWKDVLVAAETLAGQLDRIDDERARRTSAHLRAADPPLADLAEVVSGSGTGVERSLELLRQLATIRGPDLDATRRVAGEVSAAADALADHAGTDAAHDLEVAELLAAARRVHEEHGEHVCPVCRSGALDATWVASSRDREQGLRRSAEAVRHAAARLETARAELRRSVGPAPGIVERAGIAGVETTEVLRAYGTWDAVAREPDPRRQASLLLTAAEGLTAALQVLRDEAVEALRVREDVWRPLAVQVARWLEDAHQARGRATAVAELRAAERAVTEILDELRTERWSPIADQARDVWRALRQRSDVSVEEVALAGSGVRRRVEVRVTVEGIDGAALGVMSQGELHALAISLFLPRATLPESPFRFVVLDDPVQAMDAERVEGLARVLDAVALERQVIVFTHDERLSAAVQRLRLPARVLEVERRSGSRIEVREDATGPRT